MNLFSRVVLTISNIPCKRLLLTAMAWVGPRLQWGIVLIRTSSSSRQDEDSQNVEVPLEVDSTVAMTITMKVIRPFKFRIRGNQKVWITPCIKLWQLWKCSAPRVTAIRSHCNKMMTPNKTSSYIRIPSITSNMEARCWTSRWRVKCESVLPPSHLVSKGWFCSRTENAVLTKHSFQILWWS